MKQYLHHLQKFMGKDWVRVVAFFGCLAIIALLYFHWHHIGKTLEYNSNGLDISCHLKRYSRAFATERQREVYGKKAEKLTLIYGKLTITNTSNKSIKYDISHYRLSSPKKNSSRLYHDDLCYFTDGELQPNESRTYDVLWKFTIALKSEDIDYLRLFYSESISNAYFQE